MFEGSRLPDFHLFLRQNISKPSNERFVLCEGRKDSLLREKKKCLILKVVAGGPRMRAAGCHKGCRQRALAVLSAKIALRGPFYLAKLISSSTSIELKMIFNFTAILVLMS